MNQIDCMKWEETLKGYLTKIDEELAKVREAKVQLYELQRQLQEGAFRGRYERDEDTIIISAPNIIIGNVDKQGNLLDKQSRVIIRSNDIDLEGVGKSDGKIVSGGNVVTRARYVNVQTVDPGPDGRECVAFPDSTFSVQSASVSLMAEEIGDENNEKSEKIANNGGVFTLKTECPVGTITLAAENNINVSSVKAKATEGTGLTTVIGNLNEKVTTAGTAVKDNITAIADAIKRLSTNEDDKELSLIGKLGEKAESFALRSGLYKYDERSQVSKEIALEMAQNISQCITNMSNKAEAKRIKDYLTIRNEKLKALNTEYDKKATGATVNINAENVNITTKGADGKVRTSEGNGVKIVSQNTEIISATSGKTLEDSTFKLVAGKIDIDSSVYTYDDKGKLESSKAIQYVGHINLNAFQINTSSQDRNYKENTVTNTEFGGIYFNTNEAIFDMHGADGRARGQFIVNGKSIYLCPDKLKEINSNSDKNYTIDEDGKVQIFARQIDLGSFDQNTDVCDSLNLRGKKIFVDTTDEIQLWSDLSNISLWPKKIHANCTNLELNGQNVAITGYSDVTVNGELTAGDVKVANINISGALEGVNIKDGIKKIVAEVAEEKTEKKKSELQQNEETNLTKAKEQSTGQETSGDKKEGN